MKEYILRLQTDRELTAAEVTRVDKLIDTDRDLFDYVMFRRIDQKETDTILREKGT